MLILQPAGQQLKPAGLGEVNMRSSLTHRGYDRRLQSCIFKSGGHLRSDFKMPAADAWTDGGQQRCITYAWLLMERADGLGNNARHHATPARVNRSHCDDFSVLFRCNQNRNAICNADRQCHACCSRDQPVSFLRLASVGGIGHLNDLAMHLLEIHQRIVTTTQGMKQLLIGGGDALRPGHGGQITFQPMLCMTGGKPVGNTGLSQQRAAVIGQACGSFNAFEHGLESLCNPSLSVSF